MNKNGPIIIIDDDTDDQEILEDIFTKLEIKNEIIFFDNGLSAFEYLLKPESTPFLVFSDINMPRISGPELREKIQNSEAIKIKGIPFVYFSTTASKKHVEEAYAGSAQGFFVKPSSYDNLLHTVKLIVDYWQASANQ